MPEEKTGRASLIRKYKFLVLLASIGLTVVVVLWLREPMLGALSAGGRQWYGYITFFAVILTVILLAVASLWWALSRHLRPDGFEQKKDFIALIAQILGGATLVISVFTAWQSINKTQEELKASREQMERNKAVSDKTLELAVASLDDTRRRQLAERYTKAVEQLGSNEMQVRIGAIYALEKLAVEAPAEYHWQAMQVLTAYVREHAPVMKNGGSKRRLAFPPDIEAVMKVIAWRKLTYMEGGEGGRDQRLNLRGTDLRGLIIKGGADFRGIEFQGAWLEDANLREVKLDHAMLKDARLNRAYLYGGSLRGADLQGVCLEGADLQNTTGYDWDLIGVALGVEKAKLPEGIRQAMLADTDFTPIPCRHH